MTLTETVIIDNRLDDDNDGVRDKDDAFPLDPNETSDYDGDGVGDRADPDDDNDGYDDVVEIEDGTDPKDALDYPRDPDKDGLTTNQEIELGTDPANPDTDGMVSVTLTILSRLPLEELPTQTGTVLLTALTRMMTMTVITTC